MQATHTCNTACRRAMLSTAAVWLLLGLGLSPTPAEGPITKPPGPTASCVLYPVSMPRLVGPTRGTAPPLMLPAAQLPGQKSPGAGALLAGAVRAPAVAVTAPLLPSEGTSTAQHAQRQ
jgi:hypothetical protein